MMPKGWSKAPVLNGWVADCEGSHVQSRRRGQAVKKHGKSAHPPPGKPTSHSPHVPVRQPSCLPDGAEEVHKLEAAMQVLGGENNVHAKPLVEALKAARAKSRVPPVSERLTTCLNLERARKRVTRAEDLIAKGRAAEDSVHAGIRRSGRVVEAIGGGSVEANATIRVWCDGVVAENRGACPRTRRIARCFHAGSVCRRPPVRRRHPTNAKFRSSRAARVAQRTKLRIAQWFRVWRHDHHCEIGSVGGSGHFRDGQRVKVESRSSKVSWTSTTTLRKRCFAHKGTHWRPFHRTFLPVRPSS